MTFKTEAQALSPRALWLPGEESGGTVTDESGNGFDATNNGGVASGTGGPGSGLASYMAFDGVDDYLDLTTLGDFGSDRVRFATFLAWVRDPVGPDYLSGTYNDGSTTGTHWRLNSDGDTAIDGQLATYFRGDGGTSDDTDMHLDSAETALVDGNWHMLVLRYEMNQAAPDIFARFDKTELTVVYGERSDSDATANFDYPLTLAARNVRGTVGGFLDVDVAAFVIYDTNLTDQQVDDLYDAAVAAGGVTVTLAPASITTAAQVLTPNLAQLTTTLVSADLTAQAQALTPAIGQTTITLVPAGITVTASALTEALSQLSVTLTPAQISALAQILDPTPAALDVTLVPAGITVQAQALDPVVGQTTITLAPAILNIGAQALSPNLDQLAVELAPAGLAVAAQPLDPQATGTTVVLTPATLGVTAEQLNVSLTQIAVELAPALLAVGASELVVVIPGQADISSATVTDKTRVVTIDGGARITVRTRTRVVVSDP